MAGPLFRIIAQVAVAAISVLGKSFSMAYRQALQSFDPLFFSGRHGPGSAIQAPKDLFHASTNTLLFLRRCGEGRADRCADYVQEEVVDGRSEADSELGEGLLEANHAKGTPSAPSEHTSSRYIYSKFSRRSILYPIVTNCLFFVQQYEKYFAANDPKTGGSFYLQSKIFRAKELLDHELSQEEEKKADP